MLYHITFRILAGGFPPPTSNLTTAKEDRLSLATGVATPAFDRQWCKYILVCALQTDISKYIRQLQLRTYNMSYDRTNLQC